MLLPAKKKKEAFTLLLFYESHCNFRAHDLIDMFDYRRPLYRKILVFLNILTIIAYLLVCLVPFVNTGVHWVVAFPGLGFIFLFIALLFFIILWIILKSKWLWVSLVAFLLGAQQIVAVFAFNFPSGFTFRKTPNTLRIMEWNVEGWNHNFNKIGKEERSFKPYMMDIIQAQSADVLTFEEFADLKSIEDSNSNISIIRKMGYPYFLFTPTDRDSHYNLSGVAIFSKYPIVHSDTFNYGQHSQAEHLIFTDIKVGKNTFRIFTTHLQSVRFEESDYESLDKLKRAEDPGYTDSRTIISKLKQGYKFRYQQAKFTRQKIDESPHPVVLTGDFNDVPNSNTYFTIKGNLQDAFLIKGSFIGRTFRFISPTLRIDYILADKSFKVKQFHVIHVPYSDHYPIIADLQYE